MLLLSLLSLLLPSRILALESHFQTPLHTNNDYHPFTNNFNTFINETLTEFLVPGLAIAVVHGDKTFAKGYGLANIKSDLPVTPRTLFYTGSTTKSFTAATFSKLVYSNDSAYAKINWETKLADLIREDFVLEDSYATDHISFIDAMSHRTGMPRHDISWVNSDPTMRDQVRQMRYLPLHNEIRTQWEYCNLMFTAVSHAIETVTETAMSTLLRKWIWEPLSMHETFYDLADALALTEKDDEIVMATGYMYDNTTHTQVPVPFSDIPPSNGAGGVISNVLDYTHWIRTFLHPGNSSNPITASAIKTMTTAQMPMPVQDWQPVAGTTFYGLGLDGGVYRGYKALGHNGAINGYMTEMLWVPDLDWGVAIMQNAYSLAGEIIKWRLLDDVLGTPEAERFDMASVAREVQAYKFGRLEKAREILYPDAGEHVVAPALPLPAYEGVYHHPAYQSMRLSLSGQHDHASSPSAAAILCGMPAAKSFLNISTTFHHVSGEHWYGVAQMGPGGFLTDELMKAKFEVDVNGKVEGLKLQAEPAMDELAWFRKIE